MTTDVSDDPTIVLLQLDYFSILTSAGTNTGQVTLEAPTNTELSGTSDTAVSSSSVPNGAVAPVGALSYTVYDVHPAARLTLCFSCPRAASQHPCTSS